MELVQYIVVRLERFCGYVFGGGCTLLCIEPDQAHESYLDVWAALIELDKMYWRRPGKEHPSFSIFRIEKLPGLTSTPRTQKKVVFKPH